MEAQNCGFSQGSENLNLFPGLYSCQDNNFSNSNQFNGEDDPLFRDLIVYEHFSPPPSASNDSYYSNSDDYFSGSSDYYSAYSNSIGDNSSSGFDKNFNFDFERSCENSFSPSSSNLESSIASADLSQQQLNIQKKSSQLNIRRKFSLMKGPKSGGLGSRKDALKAPTSKVSKNSNISVRRWQTEIWTKFKKATTSSVSNVNNQGDLPADCSYNLYSTHRKLQA
uniref:Uncharacterized protein n=1 Tax=Ditylenchus dipsaci TaxID=166011 RepID=A0A915EMB9_9BILA